MDAVCLFHDKIAEMYTEMYCTPQIQEPYFKTSSIEW